MLGTAREAHKAQEASLTRAASDLSAQHALQTQRAAEAESLVQELQQRIVQMQACAAPPMCMLWQRLRCRSIPYSINRSHVTCLVLSITVVWYDWRLSHCRM